MTDKPRTYIAIDLKSFYASVECRERGLDPLTTNLVVADESRTEKTICLAVTPSLKAYGISGRARLFEVVERVRQVNALRQLKAPNRRFIGGSFHDPEVRACPMLSLEYIVAPPRMKYYMEYSTRIYQIYLKYIAPEDIHVYSIDEVFMDVTAYLPLYGMTAHQLAMTMIRDVLKTTGITATAGIGTNLYLCKVAMDIVAKHIPADQDGVRIAELDETSYRQTLWTHRPLTDFWRVGKGYSKKLEQHGLYTMGDIARCSVGAPTDYYNEDLLYNLFGVNAELLIDHAWGWEPCTIGDIKAYRPASNSLSSGQVLQQPYSMHKAGLIVREMVDLMSLELVKKGLTTDQLVLEVGYDRENLRDPTISSLYKGPVTMDHYGRAVPKHAHGTANLGRQTSSTRLMTQAIMQLFQQIVHPHLLVRRLTVTANHVIPYDREGTSAQPVYQQLDLFGDSDAAHRQEQQQQQALDREHDLQKAILKIQQKYGKNALLKGMNLEEGATTAQRNSQVGGHKA